MSVGTRIQIRRDTSANWVSANPTLTAGEFGLDTTTGRLKIGDGATAWTALTSVDLTPVTKSADYTATPGDCVLMTGAHNVTLPSAPSLGTQVNVVALTASVGILRGGSDTMTIGTAPSLTSYSVSAGLTLTLQYLSGVWYSVVQSGGGGGSGGGLVTAARAYRNAGLTLTASAWTKMPLDTVAANNDPGANIVIGSSRYVCPTTGWYQVNGEVNTSSSAGAQFQAAGIYKNGSIYTQGSEGISNATGQGLLTPVSDIIYCQAGDYLELWYYCSAALAAGVSSGTNYLAVVQVSGPSSPGSTVAAPQTVARAYRSAAQSGLSSAAYNQILFDAYSYDPGANLNTTASGTNPRSYTCPTTGYYQVNASVSVGGTTVSRCLSVIYKNGAAASWGSDVFVLPASANAQMGSEVSDVIFCSAGDALSFYTYVIGTGTLALNVQGAPNNYMSVTQVAGNALSASLSPTAQSGNYTAQAGQSVMMTGANTVTLPNGPIGGAVVEVVALTGTVTINRAGSDTINVRGTSAQTTCSITLGCNLTLRYLSGVWYVVDGSQTITPSPWVTPSFSNSWTGAQYMKDPNGFVHLRGNLTGGTNNTTAFTLPAGYRPGITDQYVVLGIAGAAGNYVGVTNAGVVTPTVSSTGCWLPTITFLAEN